MSKYGQFNRYLYLLTITHTCNFMFNIGFNVESLKK